MRHFFLSLLVFLLFFAFGVPSVAVAAGQKADVARRNGDERKKKTEKTTSKSAASAQKSTSSSKNAGHSSGKSGDKGKKSANDRRRPEPRQDKAKTTAPNTAGIRKLQSEKADLQREMNENSRKLSTTRQNVSSGLAHLQTINGQISDQQRVVSGIRHDLDTLNRSIGRHESELQTLERELNECRRRYARGIVFMFRNRLTQNKLMFVFSARNFHEMYRRIRYAQEYTRYQRAQGLAIAEREAVIRGKREQLSSERNTKSTLLARGREQQTRLEGQQREQQRVVDDLSRQQRELQATIAAQQARHAALNNQIDRLIQEEIRKAEQRRREEEARRQRAEEERRRARNPVAVRPKKSAKPSRLPVVPKPRRVAKPRKPSAKRRKPVVVQKRPNARPKRRAAKPKKPVSAAKPRPHKSGPPLPPRPRAKPRRAKKPAPKRRQLAPNGQTIRNIRQKTRPERPKKLSRSPKCTMLRPRPATTANWPASSRPTKADCPYR